MPLKGIVSNHVNNRRMPTGRIAFAFKEIYGKAQARNLNKIAHWLKRGMDHCDATLRLEFAYEQSRDNHSSARGRAAQLDNQLDAQIVAIRDLATARGTGDEGDPVVAASERLLEVVFPRGVSAIIHQEFEVQLGRMHIMIEQFRNDLAEEVSLLGIEREISRLERLIEEFRAELSKSNRPVVTYDQVEAARNELHEYASMIRILILAEYAGLDEDSAHKRESLLAPLTEQEERVLEAQRRRRRLSDVNPETGEEVDEVIAPADDPTPDEEPAPVEDPVPGE